MPRTITPATMPELRRAVAPIHGLQIRGAGDTGDGSITMRGHAAVFDQETVLLDWGWWRLREVIAPGAFAAVLSRDPLVHLVHEHDNQTAIAATDVTGIGGLELEEDGEGLRFFARCDPEDFDVARLEKKMRLGVVKQASFAFTIAPNGIERHSTYDADGNEDELIRITEIAELYDVSICAQGAYPQTDSQLASRTLSHYLSRAGQDPAGPRQDRVAPDPEEGSGGATDPVAPDPVGGDPLDERRLTLARLRARSRLAVATLHTRR
ncbi:MAG: HK97 family phage prohead protease [Actinomycetota bacterium]